MFDAALVLRFLALGLWLLCGLFVYLFVLNRFLLRIRDCWWKQGLLALSFAFTLLSCAALGVVSGWSVWLSVPLGLTLAFGAGELHRAHLRERSNRLPPAERRDLRVSVRRPFSTTRPVLARYELSCPGYTGPRLRVGHVSDLHVSDHLPRAYYEEVLDAVAEVEPDLLFHTGDFISSTRHAPALADVLSRAYGRLGTFAVLGNHDHWAGAEAVSEVVRSRDIELLDNGGRRLDVGRGSEILVSGCGEPWGEPWSPPERQQEELWLALSHTPDNIYRLSAAGASVVFSGHYHAGQIRLPVLGAVVVPSVYGRRLDHGHFSINGTHLYVTAGIGSTATPLRILCRPDVFVVDIEGER